MVECLFFNACTIADVQAHAVVGEKLPAEKNLLSQVRRSLLELLKSCGLPWKLTSKHIHTALLNLGLTPVLQQGLCCNPASSSGTLDFLDRQQVRSH